MGRPVRPHQPGPVQAEAHGQVLQRHVVHDLVVGPLQEGRVDRHERLVAFRRQPAREGHRVLLGDADVEGALRMRLAEQVDARAPRHRGGDRHHLVVGIRRLDQALAEHPGVGRRVRLGLGLDAREHVELDHAVVAVGRGFRRGVALALLGHHVQQDRALLAVAHVLEHGQQVVEVVPVDGPDIVEAHLLEHRARAHHQGAGVFLGRGRALVEALGQEPAQLLGGLAQGLVGAPRGQAREVGRHGAHGRRDRHVVVVEDDDEARVQGAGIVHGLVGHARRHRAVADHRHHVAPLRRRLRPGPWPSPRRGRAPRPCPARPRSRWRNGPPRRDRRRSPSPLGEARQAAGLAQGPDAVAPAGEDLVRVGLVADVPDDAVVGGVEHVVQRHRQLDHPQPRAEMPARDRDRVDHLGAHRIRHRLQLRSPATDAAPKAPPDRPGSPSPPRRSPMPLARARRARSCLARFLAVTLNSHPFVCWHPLDPARRQRSARAAPRTRHAPRRNRGPSIALITSLRSFATPGGDRTVPQTAPGLQYRSENPERGETGTSPSRDCGDAGAGA